jgi:hypothetical protein
MFAFVAKRWQAGACLHLRPYSPYGLALGAGRVADAMNIRAHPRAWFDGGRRAAFAGLPRRCACRRPRRFASLCTSVRAR